MARRSRPERPLDPPATILAGLLVLACGGAPTGGDTTAASTTASDADASAESAPPEVDATEQETAPHGTEPTAPPAQAAERAEPPPAPDASILCERLCDRVAGECKEQAVAVCRASCSDYVSSAERCPVEVEEALSCQTSAQDAMLCANVAASSCVPAFSALAACREGRAAPRARGNANTEAAPTEPGEELPAGWARIDDRPLVVSLPLPVDAAPQDGPRGRRLVASEDELEYLVESPPRFQGEATDKALLRAVLDYLGSACHKSLKVHGRFETGAVVHVSFETLCKDGAAWKGMLHVHPQRMVVTAARSASPLPDAAAPKLDSMFYGLRFLD